MTRAMLILASAAALLPALPAAAQRWDDRGREWRQIAVPIEDLDLSTHAGVREMDRRIGRAVNRICGSDRDCRGEAWWSTETQADRAIAADERMRRLANEREAQLRACGWEPCGGQVFYEGGDDVTWGRYDPAPPAPQVRYAPPPHPVPYGTTVVTVHVGGPPPAPPRGYCCRR